MPVNVELVMGFANNAPFGIQGLFIKINFV